MQPAAPLPARLTALALAILALAALWLQFDVMRVPPGVMARLWLMAGYFTVLTNALIALHLLAVALGWPFGASRAAGLLLAILVVGLIYHLVLARLWAPQGRAWWADQGLHTAIPLGYGLWWLGYARKSVTRRDLPYWLLWPLLYGGYALTRGAISGFWAYPFLNADSLGWTGVGLTMVAMLLGFAALGMGVVWLAQRLSRTAPVDPAASGHGDPQSR